MFWKKKPVTFRFVTNNKSAYTYAKPDRATKFLPEWWKELAAGHKKRDHPSMSHCHGMLDLYKKSIILPMWSHLDVRVGEIGTHFYEWKYTDEQSNLSTHGEEQRGTFLPDTEYQHIKLSSPWLMECDEEVSVVWHPVTYQDKQTKANVLSAIVTPNVVPSVNVNIMLPREKEETIYEFEMRQPLVHFIPLTEREIKIEHLYVSEDEFFSRQPPSFFSKKERHTNALKFMKEEKTKCPFGFGSK